jgi:hypothetical protein
MTALTSRRLAVTGFAIFAAAGLAYLQLPGSLWKIRALLGLNRAPLFPGIGL